ncbi:DUF938 domain-containing protein [uncultured Paraglaciecola sp.]|uniref:DUF938 domain-containing protein n=1 Tax=uncultured Paraglaciecola sp. TaxID=1765024 RepID=UPI0026105548|nr:DUF938 domain-containing protein [uncultured Paraglaciecola sp.]
MFDKPFSQACENNKQPIFEVLTRVLTNSQRLLEIGSGTGQHAAFFAPQLPYLQWHTSDMPDKHLGIKAWLKGVRADNLHQPLSLTIDAKHSHSLPLANFDAVYSANTTHIMQPAEAQRMMQLVAESLPTGGVFCQYGPFNIDGQYTSASNKAFDQHLKAQNCGGIRDIEELVQWASPLTLIEKIVMPANNFLLVWKK